MRYRVKCKAEIFFDVVADSDEAAIKRANEVLDKACNGMGGVDIGDVLAYGIVHPEEDEASDTNLTSVEIVSADDEVAVSVYLADRNPPSGA